MDDGGFMDTSLDRIQAKIAELEEKLASLQIAERELKQLGVPSAETRSTKGVPTKTASSPAR